MMTLEEIQKMPKDMLIGLFKTAQTILYDDHSALMAVQDERRAEWADFCDPMLREREEVLRAKMERGLTWMNLVDKAIGDRRPALVRVLFDDLYSEPWYVHERPWERPGEEGRRALDALHAAMAARENILDD